MSTPGIRRSPISRRFARYKMQLASSKAVATALRNAPTLSSRQRDRRLKVLARRIAACAANTTIRLVTPAGEPTRIIYRNKRRCRSGLCPPCARQRARETIQRVARLLDAIIAASPDTRFVFLTLTSLNMPIAQTREMFALHEKAIARFWRTARVARAFTGHATGIEIAIRFRDGCWQAGVHSHSLVALTPGYFDRGASHYLSQRAIVDIWRNALRADYKPICYITALPNTDAARGSLTELLKYAVAPHRLFENGSNGFSVNPLVAACLADALYKRRMCRTGGVFARRRPSHPASSAPVPSRPHHHMTSTHHEGEPT